MNALTINDATSRIRDDLFRTPNVAEACYRVLDWVRAQSEGARSHVSLQRLLLASAVDDLSQLAPVIRYLTGARVPLFNVVYELVEGDDVERVDPDALYEAKHTGEFCHPVTGEVVPDYESKIVVYFAVSDAARSIGGAGR